MPQMARARVFMSGRSQHVTIPAEYRFASDEVYVRRDPESGDLILSLVRLKVRRWGREEAAAYGLLRAKQESMGKPLGPLDTQIAAHAVAIGAVVVTNDSAIHPVSDLVGVENWAIDLPAI